MIANIKGKDIELVFSFHSFKYMQDFDLSELALLESKPFRIIGICQELLLGALNNDKEFVVTEEDVELYLEKFFEDEETDINELLEVLVDELQKSGFFKKLQKSKPKSRKK